MASKEQFRAARALIAETQGFIAEKLGTTTKTISNIEEGSGLSDSKYSEALKCFYQDRNIEFLDHNGVRQRPTGLVQYHGNAEFREFYNDLYETAKSIGGDICLCNGSSKLVTNALGADFVKLQQKRMEKIKANFTYRVIFAEGDGVFFGDSYCKYRWISSKFFNETAIFIYGEKVGFATFKDNDVCVVVHDDANIAETLRNTFDFYWLNAEEVSA